MKKVLAIFVIALFIGGITAPVFASSNAELITISKVDKEPKKAKKAAKATSEKKSSECTKEAKKDCAKTCGGSSK